MYRINFISEMELYTLGRTKDLIREGKTAEAEAMVTITHSLICAKNVIIDHASKNFGLSFFVPVAEEHLSRLVAAFEEFFETSYPDIPELRREVIEQTREIYMECVKAYEKFLEETGGKTLLESNKPKEFKTEGNVIFADFGGKKVDND